MKGTIPGRRLMDQEHLQVLAGRWEDLLADLEDEKCTCLEEMAGCLEDRSNREEEMASREEVTGAAATCDAAAAANMLTESRQQIVRGGKSLMGHLFFNLAS